MKDFQSAKKGRMLSFFFHFGLIKPTIFKNPGRKNIPGIIHFELQNESKGLLKPGF
jgi:hypothetical protein